MVAINVETTAYFVTIVEEGDELMSVWTYTVNGVKKNLTQFLGIVLWCSRSDMSNVILMGKSEINNSNSIQIYQIISWQFSHSSYEM